MPPSKKPALKKKVPGKQFSFQLNLNGIAGIAVVLFCLFLWMFLLGIWAGQTIISPHFAQSGSPASISESTESVLETAPLEILLRPQERKRRIAPLTYELYPLDEP
ncbi:MAG: hypothetical protein D3923_06255 [Candidatus Electrothrix sp. AR3]|nr:hypothetical protein [Candidatus Electrothrix sp. AR3]